MYIDKQTQSYLNGGLFRTVNRVGNRVSTTMKSSRVSSMPKMRVGSGFRHSQRQACGSNLAGDGFIFNSPKMYLHGMDGWLTDMTKPVMSTVRDVASAGMNVTRTAVRSAAPALVSAITGRPVQVSNAAANPSYDANGVPMVGMQPTNQSNTLLYMGLGLGAVVLLGGVMVATRKK